MLKKFQDFLEKNRWFQGNERGLLALSGGLDSMVLGHLLLESGKSFGIAHCNFNLRGEASDGDEAFVKAFAQQHSLPFFSTSFATSDYAKEQGLSTQLAARKLRYEWLEDLREQEGFDYLLTAHHLNDSVETLLFNLSKGTGIRGLHGIPLQNQSIIRPLLFASRAAIVQFSKEKKIEFREDASNANTKYHRNLIRKEVVPVLKKINPALEQTFATNIQRFKEIEWLYEYALANLQKELVTIQGEEWTMDLKKLALLPARTSILFEWLRPFDFHPDQIQQVFETGGTTSGRIFSSASHQLLVDREQLLLRPILKNHQAYYSIDRNCKSLSLPEGSLQIDLLHQKPDSFSNAPHSAYFDFVQLDFPLTLRRWKAGDTFQPFGMNGHHQKLQDFFNNAKLSRFEKEKVWVLESGGKICWIVGYRTDERFRVEAAAEQILRIRFLSA